jgi:hypothetical protein
MIAGLREAMKQPVERRHAAILAADVAGYGARSELRTRTRLSALCCVRPCINGRSEDPEADSRRSVAWDYCPAGLPGRPNYRCSLRRNGTILPALLPGARQRACRTASARSVGLNGFLISRSPTPSPSNPNLSA